MSDCERLRVVSHTAHCVRVVCSVSVLFVCTLFLRPGRCTRSHCTGLCQHARSLPRTECTQGWRSGRWWTTFEKTLHHVCRHSCVSVLVRAHCVLLTLMSDGERLRVVSYTAQCVRVDCLASVLFAWTFFFFLRPGRCARSHCTGLRQALRIHTPSTPVCAVPGSRATCSPLGCRELRQRQQGVSILASQTSWAWLGNARSSRTRGTGATVPMPHASQTVPIDVQCDRESQELVVLRSQGNEQSAGHPRRKHLPT